MREMVKSYISFYFHQYRVHIFMDVLRGMGNPSRICFMIDLSGNRLMIVPYEKRDFKSHSVPKKVYADNNGLEISSMKLCKIISRLYKNAVFDTNIKSLFRHISAEKGLK